MKLNQRLVLFCGLFLGLMSACSDTQEETLGVSGGTFSVETITVNSETVQSGATSRTAGNGDLPSAEGNLVQPEHYKNGFKMDVSNFGVVIYSWDSYDEVFHPESGETKYELRAGTYDASVTLGNPEVEGFGEPAFVGNTSFSVINDMNTTLNVLCYLSNAKFRIEYTEKFTSYFSEYTTNIVSSLQKSFDFTKETAGALYLKPGQVTAQLKARKAGGQESTMAIGTYNLEAQHEYVLTLDVDAYTKQMTISFSENVTEEKLTIDVSDAALNAKAPTMMAKGFENGGMVELVEGDTPSEKVQLHINAQARVKSLKMKMEAQSPQNPIWNQEFELAAETVDQSIMDMGMELHGLGAQASQMAMVDLTRFLTNVPKNLPVKFTFSVIDRFNKVAESNVVLNVQTTTAEMTMTMSDELIPFQSNTCKVNVRFKKGNFDNMKFTVAGTEQVLNIAHIEDLGLGEDGKEQYVLTLAGAEGQLFRDAYQVNVKYLDYDLTTEQACNMKAGYLFDNGEGDVWANKVVAHVYNATMGELSAQKMVGAEWTNVTSAVEGSYLVLKDLTPNETQTLRILNGRGEPIGENFEVTTEPMTQVPNGNMDDWYYTRPKDVVYWEVYYAGQQGITPVWGTMNELTTSEGGTSTNMINRDGCRYCANSGTIETAGKNGKAALIRAVGWGAGNSATGSANAKYGTVGELYLGAYNKESKQPNYTGIEFTARPAKMTFDYKYAPGKGGDSYYAEVIVMNGSEVIGSGIKRDANVKGEWTAETIAITYSQPTKKATHLCIKFKSGDKFMNESFVTVPSFGNLSDGEYVGSQLYIDNINLIYE